MCVCVLSLVSQAEGGCGNDGGVKCVLNATKSDLFGIGISGDWKGGVAGHQNFGALVKI